MIITIDGPAGTGKSTVARQVAERLGFDFLDTGAMYRAVALEALRRHADLRDAREMAFVARHCRIGFDWSGQPPTLLMNTEPVGHLLRGSEVTSAASRIAAVPAVRAQLVGEQQRIGAEHGNLVTEGRDQGSVVFPGAALKVYLDASIDERVRRRLDQLHARGEIVRSDDIEREIRERDERDSRRAVGPLRVPDGAVTIDTTAMSEDAVVERIVALARARLAAAPVEPSAAPRGVGV